jgi:uncharacterized protein (TIGR00730 family)
MRMPDQASLTVVVFCGARLGLNPAHKDDAQALGEALGRAGYRLAYGGGCLGLMGVIANATHQSHGQVIGIIPNFLMDREEADRLVGELVVTGTMHERKYQLYSMGDVFVSLAGGLGTLEETLEIITWRQLGLHDKPILICTNGGWADKLIDALGHCVAAGFADPFDLSLWEEVADIPSLLVRLKEIDRDSQREAENSPHRND